MPKRVVILSLREYELLQSVYRSGGRVFNDSLDVASRATLLWEAMLEVVAGLDVLTNLEAEFLNAAVERPDYYATDLED